MSPNAWGASRVNKMTVCCFQVGKGTFLKGLLAKFSQIFDLLKIVPQLSMFQVGKTLKPHKFIMKSSDENRGKT